MKIGKIAAALVSALLAASCVITALAVEDVDGLDPWAPPASGTPVGTAPDAGGDPYLPPGDPAGTVERYVIRFVTGLAWDPADVTVDAGMSVTVPDLAGTVDASGAEFAGWSEDPSSEAPQFLGGASFFPAADMDLYAVYSVQGPVQPELYLVTYRVDGTTYTETVSAGQRPEDIPALPSGSVWQDESGQTVDPAGTQIWSYRTFTAVPGTMPPPVGPDTGTTIPLRTDHDSFMGGYNTGLFGPDAPMTRAHVSKVLYELLLDPPAGTAVFSDVEEGAWYAGYVRSLAALGVVSPDAEGRFRGGDAITRAELAEILSHFVPEAAEAQEYPDVPRDHWAWASIRDVTAAGLFGGGSDGNFRPDGTLTRAQGATVFCRLLGRSPDGETIRTSENIRVFPDVGTAYWAYDAIMEATTTHTCERDGSGNEIWTSITVSASPLADGFHSIDGRLYRLVEGRSLRNVTVDGWTFDENGRYTTGDEELDGYLREIVRTKTDASMTRDQKLRALFVYVRDQFTYLARPHVEKGQTGWEEGYALELFQKGKGNCFSFAAAYYELAKAVGVEAKAVVGTVGSVRTQDHGWVEVYTDGGTWIYDTELEMAYRTRGDYRWDLCRITYATAPFTYTK